MQSALSPPKKFEKTFEESLRSRHIQIDGIWLY